MKSMPLFPWSVLLVVLMSCANLTAQDEQSEETTTEPAESAWTDNANDAFGQAAEQEKDVLMNFTGSDWCVWCIRLEDEVFSHADFQDKVNGDFVLLTIDLPRDMSNQSDELKAQNAEWKGKFEVSSFPSVYLVDSQGRPYAKTGYQEGGPAAYIPHLNELKAIRQQRDDLFAKAAEAEGPEKAKLLDQGLALLDENLVTTHYADVIKEIVELDAEDIAGLRTKYWASQDAEARKVIMARIAAAARTQSPLIAIRTIDTSLEEMKLPPMMRIQALQTKLRLLRSANQPDAVIELLDEMIGMEGIEDEVRQRLIVQKVYSMVGQGKAEEAVQMVDKMIETSIENLHLYVAKGELLDRLGQYEQAVATFDSALSHVVRDPDLLVEVSILKTDCLASLEKMEEAYAVIDELVGSTKIPSVLKTDLLIQKACLLRESGDEDEARSAEAHAVGFAETPEEKAEIRRLIQQLRDDG